MTAASVNASNATPSIANDTTWSFIAEAARLTTSIGTFVLVARTLRPTDYGLYVAIMAIVTFITPFANLGAPVLLVQRIRRDDHSPTQATATAMSMILAGGAAAAAVTVFVAAVTVDAPFLAVVLAAISEYVFVGVLRVCSYLAMAVGDLRTYGVMTVVASLARLLAAAAFFAIGVPSVLAWLAITAAVTLATGAAVLLQSARRFAVRARLGSFGRRDVAEGIPYAGSISAFSIQDNADKPLLVRAGWVFDAGLYAAAYRIATLSMLPVQALVVASFNRSFTAGRGGLRPALRLARRLMIPSVAYSAVVAIVLVVGAPLFAPVLGHDFRGATTILRWLAFLPLVRALQIFPANALTGAGYQRLRLWLLLATVAINLAWCLILIPAHSWRGAVAATAIGEVAYLVMLWISAAVIVRREERPVAA